MKCGVFRIRNPPDCPVILITNYACKPQALTK